MTEREPDPVPMDIDGVLDLHHFQPREVKDLVIDWLTECRRLGLNEVRIIHGKGIGMLRTIVWKVLETHPDVESFAHPNDPGSWGATVVQLKP